MCGAATVQAGGDGLVVDLFGKGFVCIITAIVCWILDDTMCSTLRNLPFGLPSPCVRPTAFFFVCKYRVG